MTMPEIIELARDSDKLSPQREQQIRSGVKLRLNLRNAAAQMVPPNYVGGSADDRIDAWSRHTGRPFVAVRASVSAEDQLSVERLETFDGFTSSRSMIRTDAAGAKRSIGVAYPVEGGLPVIDGVEHDRFVNAFARESHTLTRQGYSEATSIYAPDHALVEIDWFARYLAGAVGAYEALRKKTHLPEMPGVIELNIGSIGMARLAVSQGVIGQRPLPPELRLPIARFDTFASANLAINDLISHLCSACGIRAADVPIYTFE